MRRWGSWARCSRGSGSRGSAPEPSTLESRRDCALVLNACPSPELQERDPGALRAATPIAEPFSMLRRCFRAEASSPRRRRGGGLRPKVPSHGSEQKPGCRSSIEHGSFRMTSPGFALNARPVPRFGIIRLLRSGDLAQTHRGPSPTPGEGPRRIRHPRDVLSSAGRRAGSAAGAGSGASAGCGRAPAGGRCWAPPAASAGAAAFRSAARGRRCRAAASPAAARA
jgi:hypothetical protein